MNYIKLANEHRRDRERRENMILNAGLLSKKYHMSEEIFLKLVRAGLNPKSYIGATSFEVGGKR